MDKVAEYVKHYDDHYKGSGKAGAGTGEWQIKIELWRKFGYEDGMSVLDYGCGWGAMLPGITNKKDYLGVDISPEAIRLGHIEHPDAKLEVFKNGELHTGKFDWVVASSVFTHTPFITAVDSLKDIKQAMKKYAFVDILTGTDRSEDIHIRHYADGQWEKYLEAAGLKGEPCAVLRWPGDFYHHYWRLEHDG